jgi:hypothetical protein
MAFYDRGLPSLGTATGTDVDSPAKHIMACKVDTHYLISLLPFNSDTSTDAYTTLHSEKMKWCMHKHEIVLCTGKKMSSSTVGHGNVKAYPMVITTVGDMHTITQNFMKHLYGMLNPVDFYGAFVKLEASPNVWSVTVDDDVALQNKREDVLGFDAARELSTLCKASNGTHKQQVEHVKQQILNTPDFRCQGVALGQAFASHISGDTVASVFVGGVITVQNGAFPMQTGDLVQWYFDFEENMFSTTANQEQGRRITVITNPLDPRGARKRSYMDMRTFGTANPVYGQNFQQMKNTRNVVRIKSYKLRKLDNDQDLKHLLVDSFGDKIRIFAKCIGGGRAYDKVDIQICTQSS